MHQCKTTCHSVHKKECCFAYCCHQTGNYSIYTFYLFVSVLCIQCFNDTKHCNVIGYCSLMLHMWLFRYQLHHPLLSHVISYPETRGQRLNKVTGTALSSDRCALSSAWIRSAVNHYNHHSNHTATTPLHTYIIQWYVVCVGGTRRLAWSGESADGNYVMYFRRSCLCCIVIWKIEIFLYTHKMWWPMHFVMLHVYSIQQRFTIEFMLHNIKCSRCKTIVTS